MRAAKHSILQARRYLLRENEEHCKMQNCTLCKQKMPKTAEYAGAGGCQMSRHHTCVAQSNCAWENIPHYNVA